MGTHKVSVGIVFYDEIELLENCLSSIYSGTNTDYFSDLIVVANGESISELKELIHEFQMKCDKIKINLITNKSNNIGEGRRKLVNACKTKFLCITDPDCEVSGDWLKNYIQEFDKIINFDKDVSSLCGAVKIKSNFKIFSFLQTKKIKTLSPQVDMVQVPTEIDHSQTSNAFYNVNILKSVGSFSPAHIKVGEDLELGLRLKKNGYTNYSIRSAYVYHDISTTNFGYIKRFFKLGLGQLNPYLGDRKIHLALLLSLICIFLLGFSLKTKALYLFLIIPFALCFKVSLSNQISLFLAIGAYSAGFLSSIVSNELD